MGMIDLGIAVLLLWLLFMGYRRGLIGMLVWIGLSGFTPMVATLLAPPILDWIKSNPDLPLPAFLIQPAALAGSVIGAGVLLGIGASVIAGMLRGLLQTSPALYRADRITGSLATAGSAVLTLALISLTVIQVAGPNLPAALRQTVWFSTVVPQFVPFAPQVAALAQLLPGQRSTAALAAMPGGVPGGGSLPGAGSLSLTDLPASAATGAPAAAPSEGFLQTLTSFFSSLTGSGNTASAPASAPATAVGQPDEAAENALLTLVNQERQTAGLPPLVMDAGLRDTARKHAADMITRRYFSSTDPDGRTTADRLTGAGVTFKQFSETLAVGADAPAAHATVVGSPDQRKVVLYDGWGRVGIGAFAVPGVGVVVVQDFAD